LITTKRGKEGKVNVTLNVTSGIQQIYKLPEMLDVVSFLNESNKVSKEDFLYNNKIAPYGANKWEDFAANYKPYYDQNAIDKFRNGAPSTNWLNNVTRQGAIQNYNLSVNGGTSSTRYFVSFEYYDQKGVIKKDNYKKYTGRINIDQNFGSKVTTGITMNINQIKNDNVALGSGAYEFSGVIRSALQFNPTLPIRDSNGRYSVDPRLPYMPNPISILDVNSKTRTERIISTAFLSYEFIKGLTIKGTIGVDRNQGQAYSYLPTTTLYGAMAQGSASRSQTEKTDYLANVMCNYNKTFAKKHVMGITTGTEYQKYNWEGFGASTSIFPYDGMIWNNLALGAQARPGVSSYGGSSETQSFIGRWNYAYDERYFFTANFRRDGSSNFAPNYKWGTFIGFSMGWNIANESFMASTRDFLDQLKFRAGYGQTGNDNIGTAFSDFYRTGANTLWGNSIITGIFLGGLGNPDLKWETQTDINVGLDFGILHNRITGSIDVFNRTISDILGNKPLMSYNEVGSITYNFDAEKETSGIEASLSSTNVKKDKFEWTTDATFTYYRDRWKKRDPNWKPDIHQDYKAFFNELWFIKSDGLIQPGETVSYTTNPIPGTIKLKDIDGYLLDNDGKRVLDDSGRPQRLGKPDGKIDNADLVRIGINIPYTIGLDNTFKYKNFDLNVYAYGIFNQWKINNTLIEYGQESYRLAHGTNMMTKILERWNSDNMTGTFSSSLQGMYGMGNGDFFLEKAWFIRIRNISAGYRLPANIINGIQNLRVYGDIQNAFLFTPYTGTDPESDNYTAAYPNQRSFSLGIQLTF
jgi:TonB-linked SusC/RagA family outer membrane protein